MKPSKNGDGFTPDIFHLDKHRLDEEWLQQTPAFYEASVRLANAREDWERAKAARDVAMDERKATFASIDLSIRKDPEAFGYEKVPNEKGIEAEVILHADYKAAQQKVYDAESRVIKKKHLADLIESEVAAFAHRKQELQDLVILEGRNYWSEPRVPKEVGETFKERQTQKLRRKGQKRAGA